VEKGKRKARFFPKKMLNFLPEETLLYPSLTLLKGGYGGGKTLTFRLLTLPSPFCHGNIVIPGRTTFIFTLSAHPTHFPSPACNGKKIITN
jgi:hypothetical protein